MLRAAATFSALCKKFVLKWVGVLINAIIIKFRGTRKRLTLTQVTQFNLIS